MEDCLDNHHSIFWKIAFHIIRRIGSDESFARFLFKSIFHRELNLDQPLTFNEKIQWLKLYDRKPFYSILADKYAVREYVSKHVGEIYLNELIGVYTNVEDIPIASLPNEFVLKVTNGSGWNIICPDKGLLAWNSSKATLKKWLCSDYYRLGREWAYKNIVPKIICEKFLRDEQGEMPKDFKFFCFNGTPLFIQVDLDRFENHSRLFYDPIWKKMPFEVHYPSHKDDMRKPERLEEMLFVASSLSKGIPFCRVDLYSLPEIIFGEITLYPGNGSEKFRPEEFDTHWGKYISLPDKFAN